MYTDTPWFTMDDCAKFCKQILNDQGDAYDWGDKFCCDYEEWSDYTFNCYLYEGHEHIE